MVKLLPNGDWTKRTIVEFYPPHFMNRDDINPRMVAHIFSCVMVKLFLPATLVLYAMHHWTGYNVSLDQQGGLDACHGLMQRTVKRFLARGGKSVDRATQGKGGQKKNLAVPDGNEPVPIADAAPGAAAGAGGDGGKTDESWAAGDPTASGSGPKTDQDWAEVNSKRREETKAFWETSPFWMIVICRVILQPIFLLQKEYLKRAGPLWEMRQQAKVARCVNQGHATGGSRQYRALLTAENVSENVCMDSIRVLFSGPSPWEYLFDTVPQALTVRGRALAFRMASRSGCALEELVLLPHRGYPWKALRMINEPSLAETVARDAQNEGCVGGYVDGWTKGIWAQFPSVEMLQSGACSAVLLLALMMAWVCTGSLESLHASVRRMIHLVTQTHLREFSDIQCAWLTKTSRRMRSYVAAVRGTGGVEGAPAIKTGQKRKRNVRRSDGSGPVQPKTRRGGGPWRAWVRQKLFGAPLSKPFKDNMGAISRSYREMSAEERAKLVSVGKAATKVCRTKEHRSKSSFGDRSRDVRRKEQKRYHQSLCNFVRDVDDEIDRETMLSDLELGAGSLVAAAAASRTVARINTATAVQQARDDAKQLAEYNRLVATPMTDCWKAEFPNLERNVVAHPSEFGNLVSMTTPAVPDAEEDVAKVVAHVALHSGGPGAINSRLDQAFAAINATTHQKDCAQHCEAVPTEPRWCRVAGMCLCGPSGRELRLFRESCYLEVTKPQARAHTEGRTLLRDGFMMLRLLGEERVDVAAAPPVAAAAVAACAEEVYLHMGYHSISPWRPTLHQLIRASAPLGELPESAERIYTQAPYCW